MTFVPRKVAAYAAIAALAFAGSACQPTASNTTAQPSPADAPAATAPLSTERATSSAAPPAGTEPANCAAFYASYQACIDRAATHDPATAARLGRELHAMQEAVGQAGDAASQDRECGQFRTAFERRAAQIGCG